MAKLVTVDDHWCWSSRPFSGWHSVSHLVLQVLLLSVSGVSQFFYGFLLCTGASWEGPGTPTHCIFLCIQTCTRLLLKCDCQRFRFDYSEDVWLASKSCTSDGMLPTSISLESQSEKCRDSGYQEHFQYRYTEKHFFFSIWHKDWWLFLVLHFACYSCL